MSSNKPFPSSDLDVFKENSLILDNFVNSQENEHPDRFARKRPTITGIIKEAFNVRTDISNMNETLIGQSRWDAVPKNTSLSLGGDNGALNKQAQALFNRTEMLKTHAREALRRTYLEVGLNLVEGSFEEGANISSTTDVVLHEKTGKCYSGPIGNVPKGTDPLSGEFIDKSGATNTVLFSIDELKALKIPSENKRVFLTSVNPNNSGGAGYFIYLSDDTRPEFKGVVVKPPMISTGRWSRESTEDLSLYHFGAYGDGNKDDTQSVLDWIRWQLETGKSKPELGAGNFLITSQLPFFNKGSIFGSGFDTNLVIGLGDADTLFSVPNGSYGHSWGLKDVRFTVAPGGSQRARIFDVNGSLRGARIQDVSMWEFSRPLRFANNIWGNLILDGVNIYRISNPIIPGDVALDYSGNTMMGQNIEIIGAFDKLIKFKGSVFKLDGLNPSGSSGASVAGSGILIEDAGAGYIRSGWIELIDKNKPNGEGEAIVVKNSTNVTIENMHIPTGSIWFDGGRKNAVKNISYFQINGGVRTLNNALVDINLSGLGKYNLSTNENNRTYSVPTLLDGNNTGKGLLPSPLTPSLMTQNVTKTNASYVVLESDSANFNSGTESTKVVTSSSWHGVVIRANAVPGKLYTLCACVRVNTGVVTLSQGLGTVGQTDGVIYVNSSKGADVGRWLMLNLPVSSSGPQLEVKIRNEVAGEFFIDSVDIYPGASTFNPSNMG